MTAALAESEFRVGEHVYRAGRLSAFQQMHVASQWRDALMGLALAKKERPAETTDAQYRELTSVVLTGGLARVTSQSREEIMSLALSVVRRKSGQGWSPVDAGGGSLMFADIGLPQLVTIIYAVLDHNGLVDFFFAGPSSSADQTKREETGPPSRTARAG